MCQPGGIRCAGEAKKDLAKATEALLAHDGKDEAASRTLKRKVAQARRQYNETPEGQSALEGRIVRAQDEGNAALVTKLKREKTTSRNSRIRKEVEAGDPAEQLRKAEAFCRERDGGKALLPVQTPMGDTVIVVDDEKNTYDIPRLRTDLDSAGLSHVHIEPLSAKAGHWMDEVGNMDKVIDSFHRDIGTGDVIPTKQTYNEARFNPYAQPGPTPTAEHNTIPSGDAQRYGDNETKEENWWEQEETPWWEKKETPWWEDNNPQ